MKNFGFLVALILATFSSCLKEANKGGSQLNTRSLNFSVKVRSHTMNTRSVSPAKDENTVNDICLLFFEHSANGEGTYIGAYRISEKDGNAHLLPSDGKLSFELRLSSEDADFLKANTAYRIRVMANVFGSSLFVDHQALSSFVENCKGKTENQVAGGMTSELTGVDYEEDDDSQAIDSYNIPMSCNLALDAEETKASIALERTLARLDVLLDNTQASTQNYELVSASIWNAFSQANFWDDVRPDYTAKTCTKRYYGAKAAAESQKITARLYVPENLSSNPSLTDELTTCLIVGLRNKTTEKTSYYRLNIHRKGAAQYLKRNNVYRTTIVGVDMEGESNERDAYHQNSFGLSLAVSPWENDENKLIMTDEDMMLVLPTRRITFGAEAAEKTYYVHAKNESNQKLPLKMRPIDLPSGFSAQLQENNLIVRCSNFTGVEQRGAVELAYGRLKGIIELHQSGKEERYLELNYTQVKPYPAGLPHNNIPSDKPIVIKSSGPWTATLVGDELFSFNSAYLDTELTGNNNHQIPAVYSLSPNPSGQVRTNVMLVELDADPENYRNVVIFTQEASGTYTASPNLPSLYGLQYREEGEFVSSEQAPSNAFYLQSESAFSSWRIKLSGNNANRFQLVSLDADGQPIKTFAPGEEYVVIPAKGVNFRVEAAGVNFGKPYSAKLEVYYNGNKTSVPLAQDAHQFLVTPQLITGVSVYGDIFDIETSLAAPSSLKMNVRLRVTTPPGTSAQNQTLVDKYYKPMLMLKDSTFFSQLTGLDLNTGFSVKIPSMAPPFGHTFTEPARVEAIIEVPGIDALTTTVSLTQNTVKMPSNIAVQSRQSNPSSIPSNNSDYYNFMDDLMSNSSDFGPTGKSWIPSTPQFKIGNEINDEIRIFNSCYNNTHNAEVITHWRKTPHTIMLASYVDQEDMDLLLSGYKVGNNSSYTKVYSGGSLVKTNLWKYIFGGNGPFGSVKISEDDKLTTKDLNIHSLDAYPTTFIPLVFDKLSGAFYCTIGIDPQSRLVWIGDTEIFHSSQTTNFEGEHGKFVRNFIAYIYNVALYGDVFSKQFENDRSMGHGLKPNSRKPDWESIFSDGAAL